MIEGQKEFITGVALALGRIKAPESVPALTLPHTVHHDYLKGADGEELTTTFIKNAEVSATTVYQCEEKDLQKMLIEALTAFGGGPVLMADHAFFRQRNLFELLSGHCEQLQLWDLEASREENISYAEQASIGIGMAEMALAESGTVVVFSHRGSGRSVSLLPTYTITVIRKQDIRPRLTQAMSFLREQMAEGLPCSVNCISGASSTADIELVRVQGVHGPLATAYVIVG